MRKIGYRALKKLIPRSAITAFLPRLQYHRLTRKHPYVDSAKGPHRLGADLIVSMTSYPPRFVTLHLTLASLLRQSVPADRIILAIAEQDVAALPRATRRLLSHGVELRIVPDVRSYKKLVFTLEEFPDAYIVTADDDVFYKPDWLAELVEGQHRFPGSIGCHRAHRIVRDTDGRIASYQAWQADVQDDDARRPSVDLMPTGLGGILYPPKAMHKDATHRAGFEALARSADDLWFFWCARRAGTQYVKVGEQFEELTWASSQRERLFNGNKTENDRQVQALVAAFGNPLIIHDTTIQSSTVAPQRPAGGVPIKDEQGIRSGPALEADFSVVIPLFNKGPHIDRAIRSVLDQSAPVREIIVVDDGSSDDGPARVRAIADPRVRYHQRDTPGPGGYAARNHGIAQATSTWIAFLDADDAWQPGHIAALHALSERYDTVGCVFTGYDLRDPDGSTRRRGFAKSLGEGSSRTVTFDAFLRAWIADKDPPIWTGAVAFRRDVLHAAGLFPAGRCRRGGDKDLWLRAMARTTAAFDPKPSATYFRDSINMVTATTRIAARHCVVDTIADLLATSDAETARLLRKVSDLETVGYTLAALRGGRADRAIYGRFYHPASPIYQVMRLSNLLRGVMPDASARYLQKLWYRYL